MRNELAVILAVTMIPASACRERNAESSGYTERDSAGVRVVENVRPAWKPGAGWRVDSATVTVGTTDGEVGQQLHLVNGAVRLSDGTLIIANGGSTQLLRYDRDGRFLGASGGEGEGPGEFRAIEWIGRIRGDSIITWDRGLNRVTVFTPAGAYARDYTPGLTENPMSLVVKGMVSDIRILMARGASFIPADGVLGVQRQPITARLIDSTGREIAAIGPFPGETVQLAPGRTPNSMTRMPVPLGASTLFVAGGDAVYVIDTEAFAIRRYGLDGKLNAIVRRPYTPIPVQPEDVAAVIEALLERVPPIKEIRDGMRVNLERVPPAATIPAIRAGHVDSEDNLWVQEGGRPRAPDVRWSIFEPKGRWLGDITLPAALQILEIGSDYMIVRDRNELDVERVRVLALHR